MIPLSLEEVAGILGQEINAIVECPTKRKPLRRVSREMAGGGMDRRTITIACRVLDDEEGSVLE